MAKAWTAIFVEIGAYIDIGNGRIMASLDIEFQSPQICF